MKKVSETDEAGILDWLKNRITNPNDWPFQCFLKNSDGTVTNTLFLRYQKFHNFQYPHSAKPISHLRQNPWKFYHRSSGHNYILASENEKSCRNENSMTGLYCPEYPDKYKSTDNVIFVNYCPSPDNCHYVNKRVIVSWKKMAVVFSKKPNQDPEGRYKSCRGSTNNCYVFPETELNSADRISREGQITPHNH